MALKTMHYDEVRRKLERQEGDKIASSGSGEGSGGGFKRSGVGSFVIMQIIVKTITEETVTLYVKDTDTIDKVKDNLSRHCYLDPTDMLLFLTDNSRPFATYPVYPRDGRYLYGHLTLSSYKITHMSTLVVRWGQSVRVERESGPLFVRIG